MADSINRHTVMKAATAGTVAALAPSTLVFIVLMGLYW